MKKELKIYFSIIAITALTAAFSNDILSNYFREVYNVTAFQRGLIEFPREIPGVLVIFVITALASLSDIKIGILAQMLALIGLAVLGLTTPSFSVMLIFIFLNSMGMHLFFPVTDSLGLSLIEDPKETGKRMGQYKGFMTAFSLIGAGIVAVGFKSGIFSFQTKIKWIFIIGAVLFILVILLLLELNRHFNEKGHHQEKLRFVFRKEYKFYYILVILYGVQKQMMMVYGPWVLIELLDKKTETIATLSMIGGLIGVFFIPALGRWLDRFGVRKLLFADALSFIGVYLAYGLLSGGYANGTLATIGMPVFLAYSLFIIDKMSTQMGIVRTLYLKSIAVDMKDLTPTLSLGVSLDHVISITSAILCGYIWVNIGPQYVFFFVAALSLGNLFVAFKVPRDLQS